MLSRPGGPDAVLEICLRLGSIEFDPIAVAGRNHDLVLHDRVAGYEPAYFDELTYKKRLFFDWGGWLAVRPMVELPYWRVSMRRNRDLPRVEAIEKHHRDAIAEMRDGSGASVGSILLIRPSAIAWPIRGPPSSMVSIVG